MARIAPSTLVLDGGIGVVLKRVRWQHYRIIPSKFPSINFFEDLVDPALMEAAFALESMTNDRLREEVGDIKQVAPEDRIVGTGSSVVMAAFTHIGRPTRFSDGSFGVYYAARSMETAVRETVFHRERFLRYTMEEPCDLDMRAFVGSLNKPLIDIRSADFQYLHDPDIGRYPISQSFGATARRAHQWGLLYNSVRHEGGECIAAFRPPTVSIPVQGPQLLYRWDGRKIYAVYEKNDQIFTQ